MVLVQKLPFFQFFFQAIWDRKLSFTIFQNEKTPFQAIKSRSSKNRRIDISIKGLTYGFGPKMAIFPTFFFRQYKPGKCLLRYSTKKKNAFKTRKRKFSESLTNGSFLKGLVHGFGKKIELFLCIFFGQIWIFSCLKARKNPFFIF